MKEQSFEICKDGVVVRCHNRRIIISKNPKLRNSVIIQLYSVPKNDAKAKGAKHVHAGERLNRRVTIFALSFEALKDLYFAIGLYNEHIETIKEDSVFYDK